MNIQLQIYIGAAIIGALIGIFISIYRRYKNHNQDIKVYSNITHKDSSIKGECEILDGVDFTKMIEDWGIVAVFDEVNTFGTSKNIEFNRDNHFFSDETEVLFAGFQMGKIPTNDQLRTICRFYENQKSILDGFCEGLITEYPKLMEMYNVAEFNEEAGFPEIISSIDIKKIIEINTIGVDDEGKDGLMKITFSCNCPWDDEHGLGVVMLGNKVVQVGQADDAYVW